MTGNMDTSTIENFITITDVHFMHSVMMEVNYFFMFVMHSRHITGKYFVASHTFPQVRTS